MPLTGMTLHDVLWMLPAAIAYQFQLIYLQMQGAQLVIERGPDSRIVERLRKAKQNGRRNS
jgi:hypothetical protein